MKKPQNITHLSQNTVTHSPASSSTLANLIHLLNEVYYKPKKEV